MKKSFKKTYAFIDATNIIYGASDSGWRVDFEKLQTFGYELRLVPVKTFSDGKKKADVDSRMTFEMMLYFKDYAGIIAFTGDGDYYWVLEHLLKKKKDIRLFGCGRSIARDLKKLLGGRITDMNLLKKIVAYKKTG